MTEIEPIGTGSNTPEGYPPAEEVARLKAEHRRAIKVTKGIRAGTNVVVGGKTVVLIEYEQRSMNC